MTASEQGEQVARHYASGHARLAELALTLTDDQLATPVPATPGWDVHDVLAHLAALPSDALAGRLTGLPTDEFTAEQVGTRKGLSAKELIEEWTGNVPQMLEGARTGVVPAALAVDVLTHEQDIRGALGLPAVLTAEELRFAASRFAQGYGHGLKQAGIAPVVIAASDSDFTVTCGEGEPVATVRAPEFEFFRALAGRRGRAQVLAFDWDGDNAVYVDRFNVFGKPPELDITD